MRVIVICHWPISGQHLLRALRAISAVSYLVYDDESRPLRHSRTCTPLLHVASVIDGNAARITEAINRLHEREPIDCVVGADLESLLLIARMRADLAPAVYPMATAGLLRELHDKWRFTRLCQRLNIGVPASYPIARAEDYAKGIDLLGFPLVIKPVDEFGQRGVLFLNSRRDAEKLAGYPYRRSIMQKFVPGDDWGVSIFARDGEVTHWTAFECPDFARAVFRENHVLLSAVRNIVAHTGFTGVANFDARRDSRTGSYKMFECNPRFFLRLTAARMNGLDFLQAGIRPAQTRTSLTRGSYHPWRQAYRTTGIAALASGRWPLRQLGQDVAELARDPWPILIRRASAWSTKKASPL